MEIKNVDFITKADFNSYYEKLSDQFKNLTSNSTNDLISKKDMISVVSLLLNEGFEQGRVFNTKFGNREIKQVYYAKLYQSHKERCNYEIVIQVSKFGNDDNYRCLISKAVIYNKSKTRKMKKEINLYAHNFL